MTAHDTAYIASKAQTSGQTIGRPGERIRIRFKRLARQMDRLIVGNSIGFQHRPNQGWDDAGVTK